MQRIYMSLICLVLLCGQTMPLYAERTEAEIIREAQKVLRTHKYYQGVNAGQNGLRIVRRMPMLSVVRGTGEGFVLISNDSRFRPVLGYGNGKLDDNDLPCGFEWYLQAMNGSLKVNVDGYEYVPNEIRPSDDVKPYVEPFIQTDWHQGTPFNDWCPTYINDRGEERHNVVGCSATAMAQLMYYYQHPAVGHGQMTYQYEPKQDGNKVELSCRFDTVHFAWSDMATRYNDKRHANEAANIAVARLCSTIGIATKMKYKGDDGGATSADNVASALSNFFYYSSDAKDIMRKYYADETWMHTIFEELSNNRPIIYIGYSDKGGHAFLFDGYDADGRVHINWGWGKTSKYDGYFDINYLRPNNSGNHYSMNQHSIVNVRPEGVDVQMQEIKLNQPGMLANRIKSGRIHRLKISGALNNSDLQVLKRLGRRVYNADSLITDELTHLDLSEATLPNNTLPDNAFDSCGALTKVLLPDNLVTIGKKAFSRCYSLENVVLPATVEQIDDYAFEYCTKLGNPVLPQSLAKLGESVFQGCRNIDGFAVAQGNRYFSTADGILTDVDKHTLIAFPPARSEANIPASIDSIGSYAFRYCNNLSAVTIPSNVRVIGLYAFLYCYGLKQVTLENGVQRIMDRAFYGCDSLNTFHLPASIDSIGHWVFRNCHHIQKVTMSDANPKYQVVNNLLLSKDGKTLLQDILTEAETNVVPPSVEETVKFAFYHSNMSRLILPLTFKKLGNQSVYLCPNLKVVEIEEGLEHIDHFAFNGCSALESIHLPASLNKVGQAIFVNCTGLHNVTISDDSKDFIIQDNMLLSKNGMKLLQQLTDDKETYTIPATVAAIGPTAFRYISKLHVLTIPYTVTTFGNNIFQDCTGLTDVNSLAPDPVPISQYVFANVDLSATTLHVPQGCRDAYLAAEGWNLFGTIADDLPNDGTKPSPLNLTVNIPGTLQELIDNSTAPYALALKVSGTLNGADILALRKLTGRDENNQSTGGQLTDLDLSDVTFVPSDDVYYINKPSNEAPVECKLTEENIIPDHAFRTLRLKHLIIPSTTRQIGQYAFVGCNNLEDIQLNEGLKEVGFAAFWLTPLTSIVLPNSVEQLGTWAFAEMPNLTSVTIGDEIEKIPYSAFKNCVRLVDVRLGQQVNTIANSAFEGCTALEHITLPETVKDISDNAFKDANSLREVISYQTEPKAISETAFSEACFQNATLYVPAGTKDRYVQLAGWKKFLHIKEMKPVGIAQTPVSPNYPILYDLQGRRVLQPHHNGIYLSGSKKKVFIQK